jgi:hypothetical protein
VTHQRHKPKRESTAKRNVANDKTQKPAEPAVAETANVASKEKKGFLSRLLGKFKKKPDTSS